MIYNQSQIDLKEVLKIYSSFLKTEGGKKLILEKNGFLKKEEIEKEHKIIKAFENFEPVDLYEISELEYLLRPIEEKNFVYEEKELYVIIKKIKKFEDLKKSLEKIKELENFSFNLIDPSFLKDYQDFFNEEGFIRKDANENLKRLSKKEKILFNQIQKEIENEIEKNKNYLTEKNFVFREERYCLPVKRVNQNKIEGIVWGISSSGETVYIEPSKILKMNNQYRLVLKEIEEEKKKICVEITETIRKRKDDLRKSLDTLYLIDYYNGLKDYKREMGAILPLISSIEEGIKLYNSKHPLLLWFSRENSKNVVPLTLDIIPPKKALILTGANGGGKTIALKTIGLMVCLSLMGLPITSGEGTKIPYLDNVFISIGDLQDIEKGLSTFTSTISNLSIFLKKANSSSLVLIDEVGFGTNPEEGSALGIAILKEFVDLGAFLVASTHLNYIKFLSFEDERFFNGSMAFDEKTGLPTFEFVKDALGKSNALFIAEKFGLPKEIIEKAKSYLDRKLLEMDEIIGKLQCLKKEKEEEVLKLKAEMEKLKKLEEKIKMERQEEKKKLNEEFERFKKCFWEKLNLEIENLRKEGLSIGRKKEEKLILGLTPENPFKDSNGEKLEIKENSFVFHKYLKKEGILIRKEKNYGIVEIEGKNFWVKLNDLEMIREKKIEDKVSFVYREEEKKDTINLIGKTVEEAEGEVEVFIDNSLKWGIKKIKIIHGHGTGRLRKGIREYLKKHPFVLNFHPDERDGATIVELKNGRI